MWDRADARSLAAAGAGAAVDQTGRGGLARRERLRYVKQGGAGLNGKYRLLNTAEAADGLTPNDHDEDSEASEDRRHH
jgi:hypothetical protein